ncbi:MAG: hypothetical protein H7287_09245 [Thermoleophilia bacterium]|nr:hypothetical protein [Thermoleophilia bacterium]
MPRSHPFRIAVSIFVFALAVAGGLMVFSKSSADTKSKSASGGGAVAASKVWAKGDTWTVLVAQDGAAVSPDTKRSVANVAYRFRVERAPRAAKGEWGVFVSQDGAEGPFADGWHLTYVEDARGAMKLTYVAQGAQKRVEASVASIVLGISFPYQVQYRTAPKPESRVAQSKLYAQSTLPPSDLPTGGGESGATPPYDAPSVGAGQLPPGVPPSAVVDAPR